MPKKFISLVLCALALFGASFSCFAEDIPVSAEAACLLSVDTGEVIFEKNADKRMQMASTTKIMTCVIALENGNLTDTVSVDERAVGIEGSSLYLSKGDSLTLEDLLYAMMLRSANDAAAAVAYHIAGSIDSFASMMNAKAKELGLVNSNFKNPHGLSDDEHYTSAKDFAVLAAYAMKNKAFSDIVRSPSHTVKLNGSEDRYVVNHNRLLRSYDGACGVKTGFTKASGRCLVSAAERNGVTFVAVTLNAPDDWNDHRKMLDTAFSLYTSEKIEAGEISRKIGVAGHGEISISNKDEINLVTKNSSEISYKITAPHILFAPVLEGDRIGSVQILNNGMPVCDVPLYADQSAIDEDTAKLFPFFK